MAVTHTDVANFSYKFNGLCTMLKLAEKYKGDFKRDKVGLPKWKFHLVLRWAVFIQFKYDSYAHQ